MSRIVVDPISRIEGHLRIEAEVANGKITNAYSSGTMVRGIELILKGRDPRDAWAFAQRICGVCTTVHALASLRSVEDALGIQIPPNAELIRHVMNAALNVHDHVVHFYHLHAFDWVDLLSALKANPSATASLAQSISNWPKSSPGYFSDLLKRLQRFAQSGQLGILGTGYWGHPAFKLTPEQNLLLIAHYFEALEWQKEIVKIHTIFGGKNPHPHYVVGGMACAIDLDSESAPVNASRLAQIDGLINGAKDFVEQVYLPDLYLLAKAYKDVTYGGGVRNYLTYGDFWGTNPRDLNQYRVPRGVVLNGNLQEVYPVDLKNPQEIQEFVDHSWYTYDSQGGKHPWDGETRLQYTGPNPPYEQLNVEEKYSWLKTPRWKGMPMEVGPLARIVVGYASKVPSYQEIVKEALQKTGASSFEQAFYSALGRTLARGLEAQMMVQWLRDDFNQLVSRIRSGDTTVFQANKWDPKSWPAQGRGVGTVEAPRGALGHWSVIEGGKITNYQAVVPTTWNGSPKDGKGQAGPFEKSLEQVPLANGEQPLEILRVIHSFDPCLACAVHLTEIDGEQRRFHIETR